MALAAAYDRLEQIVPLGARVAVDTSAVIAYLDGGEPASAAAAWLFDGRIAQSLNEGVISAITVAEILVGPMRLGPAAVAVADGFLGFFGELEVSPVTHAIARSAASIRASSGLGLPDSIVLATAIEREAGVVATNDRRWVTTAQRLDLPLAICLLGDYVSPSSA